MATFVKKVDPSSGPAPVATLASRTPVDDPARLFRGRVVDSRGRPQRLAVIEAFGLEADRLGHGPVSTYGTIDGLEPMTISNANGEFELAYKQKAVAMLAWVEGRGTAPKLVKLSAGADRATITVTDGAVIRGRLMNQGKPVPNAEIGLIPRARWRGAFHLQLSGEPYDEIRIGTQGMARSSSRTCRREWIGTSTARWNQSVHLALRRPRNAVLERTLRRPTSATSQFSQAIAYAAK